MPTLAQASLTDLERRTLDRLVRAMTEELGDDLHAVWLYGSRARGEAPGEDSDVDLLVVVDPTLERWRQVDELLEQAANAEGASSWWFAPYVYSPYGLARRRAMDSFFLREVWRDRVVLFEEPGFTLPPVPEPLSGGAMNPRSEELVNVARESLEAAEISLERDLRRAAVSSAYYAMLNAARSALSEEDRYARTHDGTWLVFRETFALTGRFDPELVATAQKAQRLREYGDYDAAQFTRDLAEVVVGSAERFLTEVEALLQS